MDKGIFSAGRMSGIYIHEYEEKRQRQIIGRCLYKVIGQPD